MMRALLMLIMGILLTSMARVLLLMLTMMGNKNSTNY